MYDQAQDNDKFLIVCSNSHMAKGLGLIEILTKDFSKAEMLSICTIFSWQSETVLIDDGKRLDYLESF